MPNHPTRNSILDDPAYYEDEEDALIAEGHYNGKQAPFPSPTAKQDKGYGPAGGGPSMKDERIIGNKK